VSSKNQEIKKQSRQLAGQKKHEYLNAKFEIDIGSYWLHEKNPGTGLFIYTLYADRQALFPVLQFNPESRLDLCFIQDRVGGSPGRCRILRSGNRIHFAFATGQLFDR
jgi:hypothetical protein